MNSKKYCDKFIFKNHFFFKQSLLLFVTAIFLWFIFDYTDLDLYISTLFYDNNTNSWPYYSEFFTYTIGYRGIKYMLILYGAINLALLIRSFKNSYWQVKRRVIIFLILAIIIIPLKISFLKHNLHKPNPSQITLFGGTMPHVKLIEFLQNEPKANNWPGGHASGGAALLSLYFVGRYYASKYRYWGLALGLFVSQLMGMVQVMRGQHFLSHNLWTVWFSWLTLLIMYYLKLKLSYDKTKQANETSEN